jgi:hypothetical protein
MIDLLTQKWRNRWISRNFFLGILEATGRQWNTGLKDQ